MLEIPFELTRCSWPRPIEHHDGRWISEPEWDAPAIPYRPQPRWESLDGELCWLIDWREFFRGRLKAWAPNVGGEMRGFHVVFEFDVKRTGTLLFWDDDGSIVRRNGQIVHDDRSAHSLRRSAVAVSVGDRLQIAQWQLVGGWLWGATIRADVVATDAAAIVARYLPHIRARLQRPSGPPLKVFTNGAQAIRAVIAIYSIILNGYGPSQIVLYGEHQWSRETRDGFARALPFAEVAPTAIVLDRIRFLGGNRLADWALRYWWVMKACVCLLCPPYEFCQIDDDVFMLESAEDALAAFQNADLVYAPDTDHGDGYRRAWLGGACHERLATGRFNAGLYWARSIADPHVIARRMLQVNPARIPNFVWEQGLIACLYKDSAHELPTQKYFYPLFDGLPGGLFGYDYHDNPCGFSSVHFGGLSEKPSDSQCLLLADDVLGRGLAAQAAGVSSS